MGPSQRLWLAIAVCGAADILYAILLAMMRGSSAGDLLLAVAAGPFGSAPRTWGVWGPMAGLLVHFGIMTLMAMAYFRIDRLAWVRHTSPWLTGTIYGLALYGLMYWLVLPLRWPALYPTTDPLTVTEAVVAHVAFVGLPLALFSRGAGHEHAVQPPRC